MAKNALTPPKKRIAIKSPVTKSENTRRQKNIYTPKKGLICTLPKNFYKNASFKSFFDAVINSDFTVSGWLKISDNRLRLANILSGEMNVDMLDQLRCGGKEVRMRWAQKLNRQLRQYKKQHLEIRTTEKRDDKLFDKKRRFELRPARYTFRNQRECDDASFVRLLAELHSLDKTHDVRNGSVAGRYKRIAWALADATNPTMKLHSPLPPDSLVWVLKGHIFDSFVINDVSKIIRSLGKGDISWSNFSVCTYV